MSEHHPRQWFRTLGWAAYLGCSWTWCIGMFLPVLLLRDFGVWGFVVFAVPNVVGAAGMGWVLRRRAVAAVLYERHRGAIFLFTCVTVSFQLFFFIWTVRSAGEGWVSASFLAIVGAGVAASFLLIRRGTPELAASVAVWMLSAGLAVYLCNKGALHVGLDIPGELPERSAVWLAPVCVFGFMLCPYLDVTFLRACREAPASRGAFTLGFGVFFLAMILFTFGYAWLMLPMAGNETTWQRARHADLVRAHIIIQLFFTVLAHLLCWVTPAPQTRQAVGGARSFGMAAIVGALTFGLPFVAAAVPSIARLSGYEVSYRAYMAFYGLVFPAYVWICMIPTRDGHSGILGMRGRRKLVVLGAAIVLALPFYWMGFIERETWWLAPGLGIVLLARLVVLGKRKLEPGEGREEVVRGGL